MKALSQQKLDNIISLISQGHSLREIASIIGAHSSTISKLCSKHGIIIPSKSGGRPSILTTNDKRHAIQLIISEKVNTASVAARTLRDVTNKSFHTQTI